MHAARAADVRDDACRHRTTVTRRLVETGRLKVLSSIDVNYRTGVDIPVFDPEIGDYVSDEFEDTASYAVGNLYAAYSFADSPRFADSFMGGAALVVRRPKQTAK